MEWIELVLTIIFGTGIISSILVTWYQFSLQKKSEINQNIERVYLGEGIDPIISDISRYGLSCLNTIVYIMRNLEYNKNNIKSFLDDLADKKVVKDLIEYNYRLATPSLHKLLFFDKDLRIFNSIVNVFFTWSLFTQDVTTYGRALEWLKDPNWKKSLEGTAGLTQDMMMYLNTRLIYLSHWIRERYYCSFKNFKNDILVNKKIEPLLLEMKEFYEIWKEWNDSKGPIDRPKTSQKLRDWVSEKLPNLPSLNDNYLLSPN